MRMFKEFQRALKCQSKKHNNVFTVMEPQPGEHNILVAFTLVDTLKSYPVNHNLFLEAKVPPSHWDIGRLCDWTDYSEIPNRLIAKN